MSKYQCYCALHSDILDRHQIQIIGQLHLGEASSPYLLAEVAYTQGKSLNSCCSWWR